MKKSFKIALYMLSSLLVLGLIVGINNKSTPVASDLLVEQQAKAMAQAAAAKPNAKRDLVLKKVSWQKSGDGSEGFHTFSVYNASKTYNYPTIKVRFSYYSDFGDEVGKVDKVIDKNVSAGETIQIDKIATGVLNDHADGVAMEIL